MEDLIKDAHILAQAVVGMVLGGIIGFEREKAGKQAGIRTHMLICVATILFVRTGELLIGDALERKVGSHLNHDPIRILEAIVTGISFIGAGTVFRDRRANRAHGLTTAATMLTVAPIGAAIAMDRYVLALGITAIAWFILRVIGGIEHRHGLTDASNEREPDSKKETGA